jgi:lysophospholipase L1-like esterase
MTNMTNSTNQHLPRQALLTLLQAILMTLFSTNLNAQSTQGAPQPSTALAPAPIQGTFPAGFPSTLGLSYPLPHAIFLKPGEADTKKHLHATNHWVSQNASASSEGITLDATASPAFASPYLWSGLKNIHIATRVKYDAPAQNAAFGIKLGRVWAISADGPRITFDPAASTVSITGESGNTIHSAKVSLPPGAWLDIAVLYAFDQDLVKVTINNQPALEATLKRKPFDAYLKSFGRPAPVTGIGLFAQNCKLNASSFSFYAGAPQNRIVALGDSVTQQAFWVHELESKLGEPVTNLGIGGDSAKMANLRFDRDVLPLKPQILILFLGTNDIAWGASPANLTDACLLPVIKRAKAANIRVILCEIIPRKGFRKVPEYNAAIHKLAQSQSVPVIPWYAPTLDPTTGELKPGFASDGVHPDLAGAQAMVQAIDLQLFQK